MNETRKKDIIRLIRHTKGRFLSLTAIITIGVAFFVGVSGSSYMMGKNVDAYMDETNFRDITVYSNYGFDEEDIEAIGMISGVKTAEGSRFVDVFASSSNASRLVRIHEYDENDTLNRFVLREGRLPENAHEAVAEKGTDMFENFKIGDKITLTRPDDDLSDYLKVDEVTIVGLIDTPVYINSTKETSTLSNQYIKSYMYVPSSEFSMEVDTEVNVLTEKGQSMYAFSDKYEDYISEIKDDIANIGIVQAKRRSDSIIFEAKEKYNAALQEYETNLEKFNDGIEEGQKKLDDGEKQIEEGRTAIEEGKAKLSSSQSELDSEYASNSAKIQDGLEQLNEAEALLDEKNEQLQTAAENLDTIESIIRLYDALGKVAQDKTIEQAIADNEELSAIVNALKDMGIEVDPSKTIGQVQSVIETQLVSMVNKNGGNVTNMQGVRDMVSSLKDAQKQISDGYAAIAENRKQLESAQATLESSVAEGKAQIESGRQEITSNETSLADAEKQLEEGRDELNSQKEDGERQLSEAKEKLDKAKQDIDDIAANKWTVLDHSQNYGIATYKGSVDQMQAIGNIFPVFFFLVAALVCLTTMTRMIDEERGQIGILRALGYTRMQCASKYLIYAASATLLGFIAGSIVGTLTFPVIIYECWKMLYIEPSMHIYIPWHLILISTVSFLVIMAGTTLYVCNSSMKDVPSQLMRPAAPKLGKSTFIEHIGFIWKHLSFTWKVTIRNLIRYKRRFIMTVIGVGGCSALLVIGFGVRDSINEMVKLQFNDIIHFAGSASLNKDITDKDVSALADEVRENSKVDEVTIASGYSGIVTYGDESVTTNMQIFNSDKEIEDLYTLRTRRGHNPLSMEKGIVISEKMSQDLGVKTGDTISIESRSGVRKDVKINGICEMYIENYAFLSSATYKEMFDVEPVENMLFVSSDSDTADVQKMLATDERVSSINFMDATIENFNTMVKALDLIIIVLIVSSLCLAFVVLGNLMNINISERQREIATLKVLGFRRREVQSYIYKENNILTFFGALFGLPLGIALHHWIMHDLQFSYVMFGVDVMPLSLFLSVILTLLFGMIVNQLMKKKLVQIEMVESLKSVE